ncbi:MAG: Holliday junction branch migration protein RuvA [Patescibacteria group bacterium]|nr:Holliday junction branch migration protein RuvA [Patescibacteria group bacterium]
MIASINGKIKYITDKYIVVDVAGVGYKIYSSADNLMSCKIDTEVFFWTYSAIRENSFDLYGFKEIEEMNFFEMLLEISGIGPKSALSILGLATIETLKKAISTEDTSYLNKVSGIGRKTAERIVVELKDKLETQSDESSLQAESDTIEALKALGYSQSEARDALKKVSKEITETNKIIKEALKVLNGK